MSEVSGTTDSWRIGMRGGMPVAVVTHQTGVADVGGGSHFVTS